MKRLFITGDTHRTADLEKMDERHFPIQAELTRDDVVIVLGDWGAIWHGDKRDNYYIDWWESRNFTTFIVAGNHENYDAIEELPIVEVFGAEAYKVRDHVFIAIRGNVYTILGKKCLTLGGADSIDKALRIEGQDWWKQETITQDDANRALISLAQCGDRDIDFLLTHTGGSAIVRTLGFKPTASDMWLDTVQSVIHPNCRYKHFCGHYHIDKIMNEFTRIMYNDIIMIACEDD